MAQHRGSSNIRLLLIVCSLLASDALTWECSSSEYLSGGICLKCGLNCLNCVQTSTKCTACSTGYYLSGDVCVPCPYKCESCGTDGKCNACIDGEVSLEEPGSPCGDPSASDIPIRNACFYALIVAVGLTFLVMLWDWFGCGSKNSVEPDRIQAKQVLPNDSSTSEKFQKAQLITTHEPKPTPSMNFASVQLGDGLVVQPQEKIDSFVSRLNKKPKAPNGKPEILKGTATQSPKNSQKK